MGWLDKIAKKPASDTSSADNAILADDQSVVNDDKPDLNKHGAIVNNDPFGFDLFYQRSKIELRWWRIGFMGLLLVVITLAIVITALINAYEPEFVFLKTEELQDKTINIYPVDEYVDGKDVWLEGKTREVLQWLYEIEPQTHLKRINQAKLYLSEEFYRQFEKARISSGAIEKTWNDGVTRSIVIENSSKSQGILEPYWQFVINFVQYDYAENQELRKQYLQAIVVLQALGRNGVPASERFNNPFGMQINLINIKRRKINE